MALPREGRITRSIGRDVSRDVSRSRARCCGSPQRPCKGLPPVAPSSRPPAPALGSDTSTSAESREGPGQGQAGATREH